MPDANIHYDSDTGDVYLETYLIDALGPNKKGWGISPAAVKDRAMASVNHPLTFYRKGDIFDHPVAEYGSDHVFNRSVDRKYAAGYAARIKEVADHIFNAVYKITNKDAKRFLLKLLTDGNRSIPLFTSPGILRNVAAGDDRANIKDFTIVHNAIVSHPANDEAKAQIKEVCHAATANGNCSHLFASMSHSEECPYCMAGAFDYYLSSINNSKPDSTYTIMSSNDNGTSAAPVGTTTSAAATPEVKTPLVGAGGYQPLIEENKQPEQKATAEPVAVAVGEGTDWKLKYEELNQKLAKLEKDRERDNKVSQIRSIFYNFGLRDIYADDESYDKRLEHYANRNLTIEEITDLVQSEVIKYQIEKGQLVQANASLTENSAPCSAATMKQETASVTSHSLVQPSEQKLETASLDTWSIDLVSEIFANQQRDAANYESSLLSKTKRGGLV